jgi:hypothetical protein
MVNEEEKEEKKNEDIQIYLTSKSWTKKIGCIIELIY